MNSLGDKNRGSLARRIFGRIGLAILLALVTVVGLTLGTFVLGVAVLFYKDGWLAMPHSGS